MRKQLSGCSAGASPYLACHSSSWCFPVDSPSSLLPRFEKRTSKRVTNGRQRRLVQLLQDMHAVVCSPTRRSGLLRNGLATSAAETIRPPFLLHDSHESATLQSSTLLLWSSQHYRRRGVAALKVVVVMSRTGLMLDEREFYQQSWLLLSCCLREKVREKGRNEFLGSPPRCKFLL